MRNKSYKPFLLSKILELECSLKVQFRHSPENAEQILKSPVYLVASLTMYRSIALPLHQPAQRRIVDPYLIFVVPCIMLNSEINPTRCNNCVYSSQWLYSTCTPDDGWNCHPKHVK